MKNTATPWGNKGPYIQSSSEEGSETIAQTFHVLGEDREMSVCNAQFIVRACNNHDQLVASVKALLCCMRLANWEGDEVAIQARAALAAAGEQP